ncbi:hypothetical protein FDP41_013466 [Naegleria fowleri]|uniref:Translation machinery-associated protein 16 n=1 Tax=Naegleria fowleri TaxID=5763 RepID=A0A6A5C0D2_NAEFO|nr:uncharacterized protein FDP41_013466 [Naegleria fowleri]KAF0980252.1 hypothetical protein FDP41_013466 [Naegleria fowleri]
MTKGNSQQANQNAVHPKSRKALEMKKQGLHKIKKKEQKQIRENKMTPTWKRYKFIHDQIFGEDIRVKKTSCSEQEIHELVEKYLNHADEEFDKKHPKLTPNLRLQKEALRALYTAGSGLELPDLTNPDAFGKFRIWNKEKESMIGIPSKSFRKPTAASPSSTSSTTAASSNEMQK